MPSTFLSRTARAIPFALLLGAPAAACAADGGFTPYMLFGRLHVLTVHFPVALLSIVALIEALRLLRRATAPDATLTLVTVLAALSAAVAALMGWIQADQMRFQGREAELVAVHRWVGVATAALALLVAALALRLQLRGDPLLRRVYLATLAAATIGVSITGHYGGLMVHGEDYLPALFPAPKAAPQPAQPSAGGGELPDQVDFARDVEPIFKAVCYECHNADKQKGDLRMDSRELLLKGGATGPGFVAGDAKKSLLIQRVLGLGDDPRMPKKKDPLTDQQIKLLERWIEQGAPWSKAASADGHPRPAGG
jgi:uncharacterized membrane protein/mono/diheme cytochrome c family protein